MLPFYPVFPFTFTLRRTLFVLLVGCMALAASTRTAWAEPLTPAGYITDVVGTAWVLDANTRAWAALQRNQMIVQGDQLRTAPLSHVTLRAGSSTLWLDAQTELFVLQMNDAAFTLRLLAGDVALRLRDAQAARATRVQTREGVVSQPMEGLVRIGQGNRVTRVGVLQGRAQFDSDPGAPSQRAWLREGEQAGFVWDESAWMERQAPSQDSFSAWFVNRDLVESGLAPQRAEAYYGPPEMVQPQEPQRYDNRGATILEYGRVWIPTPVVRGWEPHRDRVVPRPHPYPQPQPQPQPVVQQPWSHHNHPAPAFDRDRVWSPPSQHQRPEAPVASIPHAAPPAAQAAPAVPVAPPKHTYPADEEKRDNPRHNKRDNLDREQRKPGPEMQR